jgi:hypothetical protein
VTGVERDEPNRFITKLEGVSHVLHSAIRCQLAGEDPFAIHILAQSAEKVVIDLLKANAIADPFHSLIIPERRAEFFETYREPVNFLKHAGKDHDGLLPVYDIVRASDLALLGAIVRLMHLGEQPTSHMRVFLIFVATQFPNTIIADAMPGLADIVSSERARKTTRGELAADLLAVIEMDANCQQERVIDLTDVRVANNRLFFGGE